jgi:hypothetical protein
MPSAKTGDSNQSPAAMSDLADLRTYHSINLGTAIGIRTLKKVKARVVPIKRAT